MMNPGECAGNFAFDGDPRDWVMIDDRQLVVVSSGYVRREKESTMTLIEIHEEWLTKYFTFLVKVHYFVF